MSELDQEIDDCGACIRCGETVHEVGAPFCDDCDPAKQFDPNYDERTPDQNVFIQNPNDPAYWQQVQHNAAHRKAMTEVKQGFADTDCGMVYEAWVADLMDIVRSAAHHAGFLSDRARYQSFREDCAAFMQLPEIATEDHKALSRAAFDAIDDAAQALYGNQGV